MVSKVKRTKSPEQALLSLMTLCARSEKSTGDAMRLMHTWGVPESERQGVVDSLEAAGYIDNRRYAEAYTREKSQLSGWGERKIALKLREKGIEREIINAVIAPLREDETKAERLQTKLERKLRTTKAANDYELRGKLLRYALSLGYEYDTAIECIARIVER